MNKPHIGIEFALTDARWCEPNSSKPRPLSEVGYYVGNQIPKVGEQVWLRVENYDAIIEAPFWAFYEHWTTLLNGIEESPQGADEIRLIRCETISPFESYTFWKKKPLEHPGIFEVRCLEVLTIPQLTQRIQPVNEPLVLNLNCQAYRIHYVIQRVNFTVYIGGDQGARWTYIATNLKPRRLVLYQLSVSITDQWEICNRPFDIIGDEAQLVERMAAETQKPLPPPAFCRTNQHPQL